MPPLDDWAAMELFLNLFWLAISSSALIFAPRRSMRVTLALVCVTAILFPIVSLSDDLNLDRDSLEQALAVIVAAMVLVIALIAVARLDRLRIVTPAVALVVSSDPRSPPRG
ncbi:MAG TPA: hypothetical protein VIO12_02370 [Thermoanaerobaculia bacterium]|jgi:hypothetical protein